MDKNEILMYVTEDGKTYRVAYYNLDVIISVGYRVKSLRGTQFRKWALKILKEYMIKGFALDDDRLKNLGVGNCKELFERRRNCCFGTSCFNLSGYRRITGYES